MPILNKVSRNAYMAIINPGEVSEWPKEHAWKVCVPHGTEGSNPSLSAIIKNPKAPHPY